METGTTEAGEKDGLRQALERARDAILRIQGANGGSQTQAGLAWFAQQWVRLDQDHPLPLDGIPFDRLGSLLDVVGRSVEASQIAYLSPERRWRSADDPAVIPVVLPHILMGDTDGFLSWLDPQSIEVVQISASAERPFCVEVGWSSMAIAAALQLSVEVQYVERYTDELSLQV